MVPNLFGCDLHVRLDIGRFFPGWDGYPDSAGLGQRSGISKALVGSQQHGRGCRQSSNQQPAQRRGHRSHGHAAQFDVAVVQIAWKVSAFAGPGQREGGHRHRLQQIRQDLAAILAPS